MIPAKIVIINYKPVETVSIVSPCMFLTSSDKILVKLLGDLSSLLNQLTELKINFSNTATLKSNVRFSVVMENNSF